MGQWIQVKDRLPTKEDGDNENEVYYIYEAESGRPRIADYPQHYTHIRDDGFYLFWHPKEKLPEIPSREVGK